VATVNKLVLDLLKIIFDLAINIIAVIKIVSSVRVYLMESSKK